MLTDPFMCRTSSVDRPFYLQDGIYDQHAECQRQLDALRTTHASLDSTAYDATTELKRYQPAVAGGGAQKVAHMPEPIRPPAHPPIAKTARPLRGVCGG